jgi:transcriptional regulator NrdR family protein
MQSYSPNFPPVHHMGLQCRKCGGRRFRVIYTRAARDAKIVRRRECTRCGERVTTWERAVGE